MPDDDPTKNLFFENSHAQFPEQDLDADACLEEGDVHKLAEDQINGFQGPSFERE